MDKFGSPALSPAQAAQISSTETSGSSSHLTHRDHSEPRGTRSGMPQRLLLPHCSVTVNISNRCKFSKELTGQEEDNAGKQKYQAARTKIYISVKEKVIKHDKARSVRQKAHKQRFEHSYRAGGCYGSASVHTSSHTTPHSTRKSKLRSSRSTNFKLVLQRHGSLCLRGK